jgi:regulatory protein
LDVFQVGELGIKIGREYTEEEISKLEDDSQFGKLYARSIEYCLMRPRAIKEVRDYLRRKTLATRRLSAKTGKIIERPGIKPEITERVLDRLIEKKYLDDEKFARFWFEQRFMKKGASIRRLKLELAQKGIDNATIESLVKENIRSDDEELRKVIAKKRYRYSDQQKLMQYLARQGFSYDDIKKALENPND